MKKLILFVLSGYLALGINAQGVPKPKSSVPPIEIGKDGRLIYNADSLGNKIPHFSICGYKGADEAIPEVAVKVRVPNQPGDATKSIQTAIDYVATLPANAAGIRGAVLLEKGIYILGGSLVFSQSGIVLRGSGMHENGTTIIGAGKNRETLIQVFSNIAGHELSQIGIENFTCRSEYDVNNPKDEEHRWMSITLENVKDAWVRRIKFEHFAGSAVCVLETASRITVEDCKSLAPVSEIAGQRRNTFYSIGKQILFQRLYAEYGYHDFAVGYAPEGPNAFVQCESYLPYSYSGTIEKTAANVLFDIVNIDGNALGFPYNSLIEKDAGPGVSNSVLWQCTAARADCFEPKGATNWAVGVWAAFAGNGSWYDLNEHVRPRSLYYAQLADRIGNAAVERSHIIPFSGRPTTSPTKELAALLIAEAYKPALTLSQWIDQVVAKSALSINVVGVRAIEETGFVPVVIKEKPNLSMMLTNMGWLVSGRKILTGGSLNVPYWNGGITPEAISLAKPHITRYVPGRKGKGLTDNLQTVINWMDSTNTIMIDHNYGLWYDRRRDDHERIRRMDGDATAPFYELPFARSGIGMAWDGLSKYDLTKYNSWYWNRLKRFADLAEKNGRVLIHENYFQHNILEAGGHYADYPWRPVNNINNTPFPEPVNYAEDKRIFIAEQYYDVTDPHYRSLHRAYIRKCLDNFSNNSNVIQFISAEYTGPLHFVQFWIDVIKEWEIETGKKQLIGLSTTKDVQDALLADTERASLIKIINIRFWHYQADGTVYSPQGAQNMSPRQHARQLNPQPTSFAQVYRAVREYRTKFPDKAVTYTSDNNNSYGWAVFMAGGSLANIPRIESSSFLYEAAKMHPLPTVDSSQYVLSNPGKAYIIYSGMASSSVNIDLGKANTSYQSWWIDAETGKVMKQNSIIKGGKLRVISKPLNRNMILYVLAK